MCQSPAIGHLVLFSSCGFLASIRNVLLFDEVLSGAKGLATASDHRDSQGGFRIEPLQEGIGFPMRGVGERVHALRSVDGYEDHERRWVG